MSAVLEAEEEEEEENVATLPQDMEVTGADASTGEEAEKMDVCISIIHNLFLFRLEPEVNSAKF